jgi:hypothetical protein
LLTAVQISDAIVGHPGGRVTVPVEIDDATGVRAAEIHIAYDTSQLDVQAKDITAGSAWSGKALAISNIDKPTGEIVVFVFATDRLESGSGSLIDVSFTIRKDARATNATVDLTKVRLNEGQIALIATPIVGADSTDGVLTITRESIHPSDSSLLGSRGLVCFAGAKDKLHDVFAHPTPHITPMHPVQSTLSERPTWLRRGNKFVGPFADHLFATTDRWRLG